MNLRQKSHTVKTCPVCDDRGDVMDGWDACPLCAKRAEMAWRERREKRRQHNKQSAA